MSKLEVLEVKKKLKDFSKERQKDILNQLRFEINKMLNENTVFYLSKYLREEEIPDYDLLAAFPKYFAPFMLDLMKKKQEILLNVTKSDLKVVDKNLQAFGSKLYKLLDNLEKWLLLIKPFLTPVDKIINKYKHTIAHVRGSIDQELEEFQLYVQSLESNKNKIQLENIISEQTDALSQILIDYQQDIKRIIPNQFPELEQLQHVIKSLKSKLNTINETVHEKFEEFQNRNVDLNLLIQDWQSKYKEIQSRFDFSIKSELMRIFEEFSDVLKEEQIFMDSFSAFSGEKTVPSIFTGNFLVKDAYSEEELRTRIGFIDDKIDEFTSLAEKYKQEKAFFVSKLETVLKESGLESKKCIICHKSVNIAEDNFIKCEFCGSLSHYACAVWWLNKYNSCPVCHHKYTLPHNAIYDPNNVE